MRLDSIVKPTGAVELASWLPSLSPAEPYWLCLQCLGGAQSHTRNALVHCREGLAYIEIELQTPLEATAGLAVQARLGRAVSRLQNTESVAELCAIAAQEIRDISGYDRVMVYRFDSAWNGEVVAEDRQSAVESYMGQHFPASDIPAQARAVFIQNWLRIIPDAQYTPVPIEPTINPSTGRPLDMSSTLLRSVSPIHLEYLTNMNVRASLTISLLRNQQLWGLVNCHHQSPRFIAQEVRCACEVLGRVTSALIIAKQEGEERAYRVQLENIYAEILAQATPGEDITQSLAKNRLRLLQLVGATGAAVLANDGKWSLVGNVPELEQIQHLVNWLRATHSAAEVFCTNHLPRDYKEAKAYAKYGSGLMALSLPTSQKGYLLWFRSETIQTIDWAGKPDKTIVQETGGVALHPRKSFELWRETIREQSADWREAEKEVALDLRDAIIEMDLERQIQRERVARSDSDLQRHRFAFLAEVSAALSTSLDTSMTLEKFAALAVQRFCDWQMIYLTGSRGILERRLVRHKTAEGQSIAEHLLHIAALSVDSNAPLQQAFRNGVSSLVPRVTDDWIRTATPDEASAVFLREKLGIESVLIVPVTTRDQVVGVIAFVRSEPLYRFNAEDLRLAEELARRVGNAVDNAALYNQSQKAIQAREHVLSVVSHDLKNPLGVVQINVDLLRRKLVTVPEKNRVPLNNSLDRMNSSCRRMRSLIDDVLNMSKLEAGVFSIERVDVDLRNLLQDAWEMLEPLAQARSQRLLLKGPESALVFGCDPERILQVFSNLVGNAIKFTPNGQDVTLGARQEGDTILFFVHDSGPGIEPDNLPHVFDRFWQARSTARQGAGLGLSIAKGIVEAHGGRIWVESNLGAGSTFFFCLPIRMSSA